MRPSGEMTCLTIRGRVPANPRPVRLELAESLLRGPARRLGGVVWLEYLQAELRYPWTLSLGDRVTLYQHDFLRSMVHQAPNDGAFLKIFATVTHWTSGGLTQ